MYKTIIFQTGFNSQWLVKDHYLSCKRTVCSRGGGGRGGDTPHNGLYREALPKGVPFHASGI